MEPKEKFSFIGIFKKKHEEDNSPVEIISENIFCNKDGSIFIEINSEINERISDKRFLEHGPVYKLKNSLNLTEDLLLNPFFISQLFNLEQELVQPPYEGDYLIQGKSNEGWAISANIADANFTVTFRSQDLVESQEENQKHLIRLKNLRIDYNPENDRGNLVEIKYGLSNLNLFYDLPTFFLESKYEVSLISIISENENSSEVISAEMTLKCTDGEKAS
jgi:hypothetical protein